MEYSKRKRLRLPEYDYSDSGAYFITICTHEKRCILSDVIVGEGLAPPEIRLSPIGKCVEEQIHAIPGRYQNVDVDHYVIMPNHIHLLIMIRDNAGGASPSPTLFDIVCVIKSLSTRKSSLSKLWQRGYYEHIIRNDRDYQDVWNYIDGNPGKWIEDRYYSA